jgi:prepilin-type N-terminal cleavage/methylation domain-containing protein
MSTTLDSRTRRLGFTLTELVVAIAVLALLAGLFVCAALRNSRVIKRAQCTANLRQFALVTHIYASESRDKLPEISVGAWAWDVPVNVTGAMLDRGMERKHFYCPGTAPRFNDNYNFLNPYPNSLWTFGQPGFRIIGYLVAFSGPASNPGSFLASLTNQNTTIVSERIRLSTTTYSNIVPPNSERVLLADATISENSAGTPANPAPAGSFVNVVGGFSVNGTLVPHLSPHLNGTLPAGGNLAFKDGHVQWRPFAEMSLRATGQSRGFWW